MGRRVMMLCPIAGSLQEARLGHDPRGYPPTCTMDVGRRMKYAYREKYLLFPIYGALLQYSVHVPTGFHGLLRSSGRCTHGSHLD